MDLSGRSAGSEGNRGIATLKARTWHGGPGSGARLRTGRGVRRASSRYGTVDRTRSVWLRAALPRESKHSVKT
jgi:hypothetical protein